MKWPRKFSDRELVERTDRFENRYRRRLAVGMAALLLVYVALGIWFYRIVSRGIDPLSTDDPLIRDEWTRVWFEIGLGIGFHAGMLIFFASWSFIVGMYWFFPSRKDRLLISLFHRLDELGELSGDGQLKREL
jgi:hypothetical protein